jgi:hypothetical protein
MQIDDATERAMFLIGVGKLPGVAMAIAAEEYGLEPVSYTHLTLPTID